MAIQSKRTATRNPCDLGASWRAISPTGDACSAKTPREDARFGRLIMGRITFEPIETSTCSALPAPSSQLLAGVVNTVASLTGVSWNSRRDSLPSDQPVVIANAQTHVGDDCAGGNPAMASPMGFVDLYQVWLAGSIKSTGRAATPMQ